MTMKHKWDYSAVGSVCYSDPKQESYKKAAKFLGDTVEDWGCGMGWSERYFKHYKGIDGSLGYVKEAIDLVDYTSDVDNILMREVLEYNKEWKKILDNVKKSFKKKFCLIISTPFVKKTRVGIYHPVYKKNKVVKKKVIPEMYFNKQDILDMFPEDKYKLKEETIKTDHLYGQDWILYIERLSV